MILRFSEGLLLKIRERQVSIAETVTSGGCNTYDHYQHLVGRLEGLREAEEVVKEIHRNMYKTEFLSKEETHDRPDVEFY